MLVIHLHRPCPHFCLCNCFTSPHYSLISLALEKQESAVAVGLAYDQEQFLRDQIDDLIAGECPLCGLQMIESINTPFSLTDTDRAWLI